MNTIHIRKNNFQRIEDDLVMSDQNQKGVATTVAS
jgi:hypothetical protein